MKATLTGAAAPINYQILFWGCFQMWGRKLKSDSIIAQGMGRDKSLFFGDLVTRSGDDLRLYKKQLKLSKPLFV